MNEYVRRVTQPLKPISSSLAYLDIELTERCNNNCIHCCINLPENDSGAKTQEMISSQVKSILTEAAALGCLQVRFTGGEPLLRPDFEEIYLFARRLGLKVLLFTNARLITPHLADLLARIPPLLPIEVTVYGMHAESYEAVSRVPGSYRQFRQGVDLLLGHTIPFMVKGALLPPNRHEIDEFEAWAGTIPWMDRSPNYSMFFDLRNRRDDDKKNQLIASLRVSPREGLAVLTRDGERYRREMHEFASRFMGPPGDVLFHCGAGQGLSIDAYGRAQPCMGVRTPDLTVDVLNSKTSGDLASHHHGSPLQNALTRFSLGLGPYPPLRDMRAANPEYLRRCANCFLKGLCEQCPAKSWAEHGTLDTPVEYLCETAHAQARWLGWLGEDEQAWTVQNWKERIR